MKTNSKISEKEKIRLREIVGEDGKGVHYFKPCTVESERNSRALKVRSQVREMRAAAGTEKR